MRKKIKIVYFLATLNAGGAEKVTVTMIRTLDPEKFDITLILVNKVGPFLELLPDYVKVIDLGIQKTLLAILPLRKKLMLIEPNIIYSTLFRTHIAIDLALMGLKKKPITIYRSPTSPKILFSRGEMSWLMKFFITKAYKNADRILAQTPEMKNEISEYHHVDKRKVIFFYNPLDTKLIDEKIRGISNPFDENHINIVALGRLSEVKGFDILLHAFAKVVEKEKQFFLHIVGRDAGEEQRLKEICKAKNIEKSVKFWGFQSNPYQYFYHSELYVLSSRREGLPNTVLENLYLKKAIVATKCIPFMSTLIEDGVNGYLVDVEDVDGMANAILKYKNLSLKQSKKERSNNDINDFFEKLEEEKMK